MASSSTCCGNPALPNPRKNGTAFHIRPGASNRVLVLVLVVTGTALAAGIRWILWQLLGSAVPPFVTFYPVVVLAALLGGILPGLLATGLSLGASALIFLTPVAHIPVAYPVGPASLLLFSVVGVALSFAGGHLKNARRREARRNEELAALLTERRESEQRFRQLADAMPQLVWTANPDGTVDYYNERAREFSGFHWDESTRSWSWEGVLHPDDQERSRAAWAEAVRTGKTYELEHRVRTAHNTYHWVLSRAMPARDASDRIVKWFGTATDIQQLKQTQAALDAARHELHAHAQQLETTVQERTVELQSSLRSIEDLLYTIAHDLRAPNRAMQGLASILLDDYGPVLQGDGCRYLEQIRRAAVQNDRLICDLLAYGRLSHVELPRERLPLGEVVDAILASLAPEIESRQATVHRPARWPVVLAARSALESALTNLTANALKFVAPGVRPELRFTVEDAAPGWVRLGLQDNGIGIPAEHQQRIWQPFSRLQPGAGYEGTGMGLAIVRKGVERMGGRVRLESSPGHGSEFMIELPVPTPSV